MVMHTPVSLSHSPPFSLKKKNRFSVHIQASCIFLLPAPKCLNLQVWATNHTWLAKFPYIIQLLELIKKVGRQLGR